MKLPITKEDGQWLSDHKRELREFRDQLVADRQRREVINPDFVTGLFVGCFIGVVMIGVIILFA